MDYNLFLAYPLPYAIYSLSVGSAISLFLAFYIAILIAQARKDMAVQPVQLPLWLAIQYPGWLDKLTFPVIGKAFIQALVIAVVLWVVLMSILVALLAKVYGP